MSLMKILDFFFFFLKRFLFDKQQCTGPQKVDSVLLIFLPITKIGSCRLLGGHVLMSWMKILDFFFLKRFLFDKQQCTGHQKVDSVLLFFFLPSTKIGS